MSDQVFYRKYRPQSFSQIIGQDVAKRILINSILSNNYSHAYLFTGPRGTGKTTTARTFAKSLNCLNFKKNNDVCNECENCEIFNSGQAIDVIEMDAASNRGIDDVRSLRENILFMPSVFKKKIYIIDEAHMLSREAFNALLKTLEEPPEHVVFILATTESNKIPITIMSRLVRIDFELASELSLENKLKSILENESIKYDTESLKFIINYARGSFRDAESILTKITQDSKILKKEVVQDLLGIVDEELVTNFINDLISNNIQESTLQKVFEIKNKKNFFESVLEAALIKQLNKDNINSLLKIIFNIDKLDNKKLVIDLYLSNFKDNTNKETIQKEQNENQKNSKIESKKLSPAEKGEEISNKVEIKIDVEKGNPNNKLITKSFENLNVPDDRAKSIIESSSQYLDNKSGILYIFTSFKFNLNYLIKEDIYKKLLLAFREQNQNVHSLKILLDTEKTKFEFTQDENTKDYTSRKENGYHEADNQNLQSKKDSNKYDKQEKVSDTKSVISKNSNQIEDNSDIIEGIL